MPKSKGIDAQWTNTRRQLMVGIGSTASIASVAGCTGAADSNDEPEVEDNTQMSEKEDPLTILLARHGQTEWNAEGRLQGNSDGDANTLNEVGIEQAEANAEALEGIAVSHIYSSELRRASETAEILSESFSDDTPITELEDLNERSRGVYEGEIAEEVEEEFRPRFESLEDDMDGGESLESIADRVGEATREIVDEHSGENVLVVGHSGVNPLVIGEIIDLSPAIAIRDIEQGNDQVLKLDIYDEDDIKIYKYIGEDELDVI